MPNFFGSLFRSAFLVNKKSLFLQKCQCIELLTVFRCASISRIQVVSGSVIHAFRISCKSSDSSDSSKSSDSNDSSKSSNSSGSSKSSDSRKSSDSSDSSKSSDSNRSSDSSKSSESSESNSSKASASVGRLSSYFSQSCMVKRAFAVTRRLDIEDLHLLYEFSSTSTVTNIEMPPSYNIFKRLVIG